MSRLYLIEVHVDAPESEHKNIIRALEHWGADIDGNGPEGSGHHRGYLFYSGEITLCVGKDEHDAHAELRELIPNHKLTTKWFCIEFHEWDEVIED